MLELILSMKIQILEDKLARASPGLHKRTQAPKVNQTASTGMPKLIKLSERIRTPKTTVQTIPNKMPSEIRLTKKSRIAIPLLTVQLQTLQLFAALGFRRKRCHIRSAYYQLG